MILYHGSTNKYDVLIPHQAYDTGYAEGCQNAVYASSEKEMAMGSQWVCFEPVKPLEIIEINVDDYLEYAVITSEYLKNPCGTYSIPYWKNKTIQIPNNMKILHDREFEDGLLLQYNDEKYFRIKHDLKDIQKVYSEEFYIKTASIKDIRLLQELINRSYEDLSVTYDQLLGYTKSVVYDENLWVIAYEKATSKPIGCGIAELDKELKEGILEWIQVLPEYRGKKVGQLIVNELLSRLKGKADFVTVSGKVDNATKPELLYRKCGFTGEDIWHILKKKGNADD